MSSSVNRVYTIVHFTDPATQERLFLVGVEAVLHNRARADMLQSLGSPAARDQRKVMRDLISSNRAVLQPKTGRVAAHGPWRGGNFGGILLIGRPALAGGRVERGENLLQAAARELVEELRLPQELFDDPTCRTALQLCLQHVCDIKRPGRNPITERYFSLDLDVARLSNARVSELLSVDGILKGFEESSSEENADRAEKRAVRVVDSEGLVQVLDGPPEERDVAFIRQEVAVLARDLCDMLGVTAVPETLVDGLVDFQRQRRIPNHVTAAQEFLATDQ